MGLIVCPACGDGGVSSMATACPQCGHPMASAVAVPWNFPPEKPGNRLSSSYVALTIFGIIGSILGIILLVGGAQGWGMSSQRRSSEWSNDYYYTPANEGLIIFGGIIIALGIISCIVGSIFYLVWLYKAWKVASRRPEDPSPGQAVGFLFIPFFNFYWVFRAVPGLSAALHRNLRQVNPSWSGGTAGHGLGIATEVISVIPYVNLLSPIFYLIWVPTANRAKNELLVLDEQRRLFAEEEGQIS